MNDGLSPTEIDRLLSEVEARKEELVELTRDLIRFPTVNPPGESYRPCAEYLGRRLARRGFQVEYIRAEGAPGDSDAFPRVNVVARYESARPGPCLHFNGHLDVVLPGSGWTLDPFGGEIRDGRIYGRGSCDMKGGLAAAVVAVESLIDSGLEFCGAIEISGTIDEESGGIGGVAYLARRGYFSEPRVNHVIIPEPLNVDQVCIGHRGVWWAEIKTLGRIAHGSMPFLGDSAIRHMSAVLERFEHELYPALATRRSRMPVVPQEARQSTMNINSIHGGEREEFDRMAAPCVADSCRIVIDRRFLVEESLASVRGEVVALLDRLCAERPKFRYEIHDLLDVEPNMIDQDGPISSATRKAVRRVIGKDAGIVCSPGSFDQKHIRRIGHLEDCIAYGPGRLDLAHQPDEWVGIADMVSAAKVMAAVMADLLASRPT